MAESKEELKILLMKVKEEREKVGLKLNIQKTKIMASGPITSWQIDGETMADFILGGSKFTADVFLLAILILARASSSPAFLIMYAAYKLKKQDDNKYSFPYLEPVCCSMPSSYCCFLTSIQISQEADKMVWYSHLLKNFLQFVVIYTVKGFGVVNKAEVDVFLGLFHILIIQHMLEI